MDSSFETVLNDILSGKLDSFETKPLNPKERSEIYEILKKYENIIIESISINGSKLKKLIFKLKSENIIESQKITPELIDLFVKYSRIPIPINSTEHINYYLRYLDRYYNSIEFYELFKTSINTKSEHTLKKEINDLHFKIIEYINSNVEFKKFKETKFDIPHTIKKDIYTEPHKNRYFISIDVRTANFRSLKHYCPSICEPSDEWTDFIRRFTNNEFIIKSKQFREVVFGELGCKKILNIPTIFIDKINKHILSDFEYSESLKMISFSGDEIIYEVNEKFDSRELEKFVNRLMPSYFKVEMFKLIKFDNHDIYVREYTNGKRDFKKVQKKFILQAIKHYESLPIEELDRKFTDSESGMVATFDKAIFESKLLNEIIRLDYESLYPSSNIIKENMKYDENEKNIVREMYDSLVLERKKCKNSINNITLF